MYLSRLKIQGFRSLYDAAGAERTEDSDAPSLSFDDAAGVEIELDPLTVLIGCNDTGKSSVISILDIVLNRGRPDAQDFHQLRMTGDSQVAGGPRMVRKIVVHLEFRVDGERDAEVGDYAGGGVLVVRAEYTPMGSEMSFLGSTPLDARLGQDFSKMKAPDQIALIKDLDGSAIEVLQNASQRAEWLAGFAQRAPRKVSWLALPRPILDAMPRLDHYSALDYDDPSGMVLKTLKSEYESVAFEDVEVDGQTSRRPVQALRDLKDKVDSRIHDKVQELLDHIKLFNKNVTEISFDPTVDFSGALKQGQFQINDGHGLRYLMKVGDGTKRRLFLAIADWDKGVALASRSLQGRLPSVIRGYDEPDANLDYRAQRAMFQSISEIVNSRSSRFQALVCTHSPRFVDQAPAQSIRLLQWDDGQTSISRLDTDNDPEVEDFLCSLARELGLSNTLMFYERCFVLIEGETEANALPLLYRSTFGHSLIEDGIRLINVQSNGAFKELFRLMSRNRQDITLVFADLDTESSPSGKALTKAILKDAKFKQEFLDSHVFYVPSAPLPQNGTEFEAAFPDNVISCCLQSYWPKQEGAWTCEDIALLRKERGGKFSDLLKSLVWEQSSESGNRWSKPEFGRALGRLCVAEQMPDAVAALFKKARDVAGCE